MGLNLGEPSMMSRGEDIEYPSETLLETKDLAESSITSQQNPSPNQKHLQQLHHHPHHQRSSHTGESDNPYKRPHTKDQHHHTHHKAHTPNPPHNQKQNPNPKHHHPHKHKHHNPQHHSDCHQDSTDLQDLPSEHTQTQPYPQHSHTTSQTDSDYYNVSSLPVNTRSAQHLSQPIQYINDMYELLVNPKKPNTQHIHITHHIQNPAQNMQNVQNVQRMEMQNPGGVGGIGGPEPQSLYAQPIAQQQLNMQQFSNQCLNDSYDQQLYRERDRDLQYQYSSNSNSPSPATKLNQIYKNIMQN